MPDITELDPSELDTEDYEGMPDLCDNEPVEAGGVPAETAEVGGVAELGRTVDSEGWEDVLGSGRLRKKVVREGDRARGRPEKGASCTINFTERLAGGRDLGRREAEVFIPGDSELLQCLELAVPLMFPGELALIALDTNFGYGSAGDGARVPPDSDLELELELVDWEVLGPVPDIARDRRMSIGVRKRERGNRHFARGDFSTAVRCYRKAAEYLDDKQIEDDMEVPIDRFLLSRDLQDLLQERVKTFNNMAQAQMKLTAWDPALSSVRQVLKVEPNNEKALFRKSKILMEKCQLDEAIGILRRVNRLYPANSECQSELARLTSKVKKSKEKEQMMSRKMLGLDKNASRTASQSFFSQPVKIVLAAVGGLGALGATFLLKHYNLY